MQGEIFSDRRIGARIEELTRSIIEKESVVIHRLAKDEAQQRSFYRLLHNPRLETGQVVDFIRQDCVRQLEAGADYLVIQDTTQPCFERNRRNISCRQQLGVIGDNASLGFFLHPSLVVAADTGRCIGYSDVRVWDRPADAPAKAERNYKKLPIEEKESYRWIQAATASNALLGQAGTITHICDREGDILALFERVPQPGRIHLLVRSAQDRRLAGGQGRLSELLASLPEAGRHCLLLKADVRTGRQQREAILSVRYSRVSLLAEPAQDRQQVAVYVVEAREVAPPAGQKPVEWRLLTTHPVEDLQQALQVLTWYAMRWNIEQVFRLLKHKGLDVEALDVETGKALVQLSLLALFAVCKIMLLHLASKQDQPLPVEQAFTAQELECMRALHTRYQGRTARQQNPYPPDTLQWCYWVLARMGGWKPQEKQAGVITLHRGLMDFYKIFHGWTIAQKIVS